MPGQRQRRQPQPRRPALGPVVQQGQRCGRTAVSRPPSNSARASATGEAQVGRADLGELPRQPQPVQAQPQIMPGGQGRTAGRAGARMISSSSWRSASAERSSCRSSITSQTRSSSAAEIGEQPLDDRPAVQIGSRRQRPRPASTRRPCPAARRTPTARTAAGRVPRPAPAPTRHARPGPLSCDPGAQQERLPASGRRRHLGYPPCAGRAARTARAGRQHRQRCPAPGRAIAGDGNGRVATPVPVQLAGLHGALLDRPAPYLTSFRFRPPGVITRPCDARSPRRA